MHHPTIDHNRSKEIVPNLISTSHPCSILYLGLIRIVVHRVGQADASCCELLLGYKLRAVVTSTPHLNKIVRRMHQIIATFATFHSCTPAQRPLYCCTNPRTLESNRFEEILEESIEVNGFSKLSVYKRWIFDYS